MINKIQIGFLLIIFLVPSLRAENIEVLSSNQYRNKRYLLVGKEGNKEILEAKGKIKNLGSTVRIIFKNNTKKNLKLKDIIQGNENIKSMTKSYQLIWYRMLPETISPGKTGEIQFCLRKAFEKDTKFEFKFHDNLSLNVDMKADMLEYRIMSIAFEKGLKKAFIYAESRKKHALLPQKIIFEGKELNKNSYKWLNKQYIANVMIAQIDFPEKLKKGKYYSFVLHADKGGFTEGACIRAFDDIATFGTYGAQKYKRYAKNFLNSYNSFGKEDKSSLDTAEKLGIKVVSKAPSNDAIGHKALYGYLLRDEPDCADYGAKNRPMGKRIGTLAPEMVEIEKKYRQQDPSTPTFLTIDLTFVPFNYFIYSPIADIVNPDIYTISHNWKLKTIDHHMDYVKNAAAPRPFTFTYLGCWEEIAIKRKNNRFVGRDEIIKKGFKFFSNPKKTRGYGRAPAPEEVRISMLYAIGNGAKGLFSFFDMTHIAADLLFHGSEDLPEVWAEIGNTSKSLRRVKELIERSYSVNWAKSNTKKLFTKTLFAGSDTALIICTNESYISEKGKEFSTTKLKGEFSFKDLPFLNASKVYRVEAEGIVDLKGIRKNGILFWKDIIKDAQIYLICKNDEIANKINNSAEELFTAQKKALNDIQLEERRIKVLEKKIESFGKVVFGAGSNGVYQRSLKKFWNPKKEKRNAYEAWERKGRKTFSIKWEIDINDEMTKEPCMIAWQGRFSGADATIKIFDSSKRNIYFETSNLRATKTRIIEIKFPTVGKYTIEISQTPEKPKEHGCLVAKNIYIASNDMLLKGKRIKAIEKNIESSGKVIFGSGSKGVYQRNIKRFWNPKKEKYNAYTAWERKGVKTFSLKWKLDVDAKMTKENSIIAWQGGFSGADATIKIFDSSKKNIYSKKLNLRTVKIRIIELKFPKAGTYTIAISQTPEKPKEHGCLVAKNIYIALKSSLGNKQ